MSNKTACIILADGFEEVEALMPADIFKRLKINVILVGLKDKLVTGAHGFQITANTLAKDISVADFDALILPGGLPGATNLQSSPIVTDLLHQANAQNKICAAICAAPIVLHDTGVAQGKTITGYPGCEGLAKQPNCSFSGANVEVDGNIISAIGMGKAHLFAFAIAKALGISAQEINNLAAGAFLD